jgi:tyrosinase
MAALSARQSLSHLKPEELSAFRRAIRGVMDRHDNRGFQFYAGWHGIPLGICEHHNRLFLPWHRAYLYHFELALQDIDASVALPWWDWLTEPGLPEAYTVAEADGAPNPLLGADVAPMVVQPNPAWPTHTHRKPFEGPGPGPLGPPLAQFPDGEGVLVDTYTWLMSSTSFDQFSMRCEQLHDNMHGWVGGEMRNPTWAAYDPLFWAHHAMVDRLWRIWQGSLLGEDPVAQLLDVALTSARPPTFTVRGVLDVTLLGYDYAAQTASVSVGGAS